MNKKLILFLGIITSVTLSLQIRAQSWVITGNGNTAAGSKLGTTNNRALRIFTNNQLRMFINPVVSEGYIGIGTTSPNSKLHINSPTSQTPLRVQVNGATKFFVDNEGGVSVGGSETATPNGLFVSGNTGLGTDLPESKLHVFKGSAGSVTGHPNASLVLENSTHNYINLLAPNTAESGILFGRPSSSVSGGLIYNAPALTNGFQFRTHNNTTRMVLTGEGSLGVGTNDPEVYKTRIRHDDFGFDIQNSFTSDHWELVTLSTLQLWFNDNFRGSFNITNGIYTPVSDERLKTNIKPMTTMLEKINNLKPSTYQIKNAADKQEYMGFIAQDVLKIFPSLVSHNVNKARNLDLYTLDYSGFGVIAVKGIQELQPVVEEQKRINEEQKATILALEDRLSKLEAVLANINAQNGLQNTGVKGASLEQNDPNPLNQNTIIRYRLPQGSRGQIRIFDQKGNLVKTLIANESGLTKLNGYELNAGTYNYSLIVNGRIVNTKKMVVLK